MKDLILETKTYQKDMENKWQLTMFLYKLNEIVYMDF